MPDFANIYRWSYNYADSMGLVAANSEEEGFRIVAKYISENADGYDFDPEELEVWSVYRDDGYRPENPNIIDFYGV